MKNEFNPDYTCGTCGQWLDAFDELMGSEKENERSRYLLQSVLDAVGRKDLKLVEVYLLEHIKEHLNDSN